MMRGGDVPLIVPAVARPASAQARKGTPAGPALQFNEASGCGGLLLYTWNEARTEVLMAFGAPAGLLPQMPKLRWIQCMMAGVEGWLALPDFPADLPLTCARGTHEEDRKSTRLNSSHT